jgi:hypothetical protein
MDRHVRLDVQLPPTLSYSDLKDPQLTCTFTLINSATPVTLVRLDARLVPIVNCLTISETDTGAMPQLPTVDTYRKGPPGTATQEDMDRLLTLHPDIPYVMSLRALDRLGMRNSPQRILAQREKVNTDFGDSECTC